jgi:tRNA threonylcarbamoyladenosine biosynthesis protein TsaE
LIPLFSCSKSKLGEFAGGLVSLLNRGSIIFLKGGVGAGKTTFARTLVQLISGNSVRFAGSPTFPIMTSYPVPRTERQILHFDLYRLEDDAEFFDRGLWEEIAQNKFQIAIFEWAEKHPEIRQRILEMKLNKAPARKIEVLISGGKKPGLRTYAVRGL